MKQIFYHFSKLEEKHLGAILIAMDLGKYINPEARIFEGITIPELYREAGKCFGLAFSYKGSVIMIKKEMSYYKGINKQFEITIATKSYNQEHTDAMLLINEIHVYLATQRIEHRIDVTAA